MTTLLASATTANAANGLIATLLYVVIFGVAIYFLMIKPQKKEQEKQKLLQDSIEVGDAILTTSGFFGNVIGIVDDDTIIVEFGNNKNCRIPMKKAAVAEVDKAKQEV